MFGANGVARRPSGAALVCILILAATPSDGQGPNPSGARHRAVLMMHNRAASQPLRVAERTTKIVPNSDISSPAESGDPSEHPLMPAIRWARANVSSFQRINDYSAILAKRERIGGKLTDFEYIFLKIRHKPTSVYLYFMAPNDVKGQEVIYVEGTNDGKMWAHGVGMQQMLGTMALKPDGPIAMRGQRYPVTEIGMFVLTRRLIMEAEKDVKYGECEVKFFKGAKIDDRTCTCMQVTHPVPRVNFRYHLARIFIDDQWNLPIRFEAYEWPKEQGGPPELSRGVHVSEPQVQQRLHRQGLRYPQPGVSLPLSASVGGARPVLEL